MLKESDLRENFSAELSLDRIEIPCWSHCFNHGIEIHAWRTEVMCTQGSIGRNVCQNAICPDNKRVLCDSHSRACTRTHKSGGEEEAKAERHAVMSRCREKTLRK